MSTATPFALIGSLGFLLVLGGVLALGRKRDPVTLSMGVAWYAYTALALSATVALAGLALFIKALVGYISQRYAYPTAAASLDNGIGQAVDAGVGRLREQDLILGIILALAGAILVWLHLRMGRDFADPLGALPTWISWGTPVITVAFYGVVGLAATIGTVNGVAQNTLLDNSGGGGPNQFGEGIGLALAFTPAWALLLLRLFRTGRLAPGAPGYAFTALVHLAQPGGGAPLMPAAPTPAPAAPAPSEPPAPSPSPSPAHPPLSSPPPQPRASANVSSPPVSGGNPWAPPGDR